MSSPETGPTPDEAGSSFPPASLQSGPPAEMPPASPDRASDTPLEPAPAVPVEPVRARHPRTATTIVAASLALVAVLGGAALFLSGYSLGRQAATTPGTPVDEAQLFQPFWDAYRSVTERYAGGPVDRQKLVEGAIRGMIKALDDQYSMYLSPEELRQSLEVVNGQFEGVGVQIGTESASGVAKTCGPLGPDCLLVVITPIEGSPAARAGVKAGDVVASVDGSPVGGLTVDAAAGKISGPRGTTVTLGIVRGGQALSIAIVRDVIEQKEVTGRDLARGRVGYIRVTRFSTDAPADFVAILKDDLARGERKFVIDLRGDPGGFIDAARDIASQFIASGPIFYQEDSRGSRIETDAVGGGLATDPSIGIVVLVDGGTASASEILAGALHDRGRATLVGQRTFGKGTMQEWNQLEGGFGGFRLTIAKWLTPDGTWVHEKGITPDVVVAPATNGQVDAPLARALDILGEGGALAPAA